MNFGKLLATGKSIISGRVSAKYSANKNVYLPKFAAAKNPFVLPTAPATTPELPVTPKSDPALVGAKTRPLPTVPPVKAEKLEKAEKSAPAGWVSKISSVSIWRGWQAEVKEQHPPVQTELSLQSVKVVHNDLSDADVEVVPIKSRPVPVKPVPKETPAPARAWDEPDEEFIRVN